MKYRDVEAALLARGCTWRQGKGDHRVWYCPCGQHMAVVPGPGHLTGRDPRRHQEDAVSTEGVVAMTTYTVRAERWEGGWELHIDGLGVTQSRTLATAQRHARDYIETATGTDLTQDDVVTIIPSLGDLTTRAERARKATRAAAAAQERAAAQAREVASDLRASGLSVQDVAAVMHVSRGRVSQLTSPSGADQH